MDGMGVDESIFYKTPAKADLESKTPKFAKEHCSWKSKVPPQSYPLQ